VSFLVTLCGALCAFFAVSGILLGCVLIVFGGRGRRLLGTMLVLWWASGSSAAAGLLLGDVSVVALGIVVWASGGLALVIGSSVGPEKPPDFTA
jgi:hypothetical protein